MPALPRAACGVAAVRAIPITDHLGSVVWLVDPHQRRHVQDRRPGSHDVEIRRHCSRLLRQSALRSTIARSTYLSNLAQNRVPDSELDPCCQRTASRLCQSYNWSNPVSRHVTTPVPGSSADAFLWRLGAGPGRRQPRHPERRERGQPVRFRRHASGRRHRHRPTGCGRPAASAN